MELLRNPSINKYAIELVEDKQPLYKLIYALSPMELEILKAYIETYLKTGFIQSSKFLAKALIIFDKKADKSSQLRVDYWGLNNLVIKNRYLLLF